MNFNTKLYTITLMNKHQIVNELAKNKVVEKLISKKTTEHVRDLAQDIYIVLLEKPEEKIVELYNKNELIFFISAIVRNQVFSTTSGYYKQYKSTSNFLNIDELNI